MAASSDDLIGLEEEDGGDGEAQRLRGLEVEREPKARRLLERQVGGLRALENASDEGGYTVEAFVLIRAIGHEAAVAHELIHFIDGGEVMGRGERKDPLAVEQGERIGDHEDRIRPLALHRCKRLLKIVGLTYPERLHAEAQGLRACL